MNWILVESVTTWNVLLVFCKRSRNGIRGVESVLVLFIVRQRKESSVPYDERCEIAKDTKDTKAMSDDESIESRTNGLNRLLL